MDEIKNTIKKANRAELDYGEAKTQVYYEALKYIEENGCQFTSTKEMIDLLKKEEYL